MLGVGRAIFLVVRDQLLRLLDLAGDLFLDEATEIDGELSLTKMEVQSTVNLLDV